jgi:transposase
MSKAQAARTFRVGATSVKRYVKLAEEGRPLNPGKAPGRKGKLAPSLRGGQIVVADNLLGAHKSERARELVEGRGCQALHLPAYSPDFNPVEEAFSKIKGTLRKAQARTAKP